MMRPGLFGLFRVTSVFALSLQFIIIDTRNLFAQDEMPQSRPGEK